MVRKSQIIGILLSFVATSALANNGFYIGAGLGPDFANFDANAKVRQAGGGHVGFNVKNDAELSGTGVFGTIYAGYGMKFSAYQPRNNLYLAGELNANISSLKHQDSNDEYVHKNFNSTTFKMQDSFGISVLPGYLFTDTTLFYGRLGYTNGNFKISTSDVSLANINKNLNGFRWGVGLQQLIAPQVSLRVEYSHVSYNDTSVSTLDAVSGVTKSTDYTPNTGEVEFGLVYNFC